MTLSEINDICFINYIILKHNDIKVQKIEFKCKVHVRKRH